MNVTLIEESKEQAQAKLKAYRSVRTKHANTEYHAAVKAYKSLAAGKSLIDLVTAFDGVALDTKGRPLLAIARADKKGVLVQCRDGEFEFDTRRQNTTGYWQRAESMTIRVLSPQANWQSHRGYAMTPLVPPECLPVAALSNFYILWEVEAWADDWKGIWPDRDPLLLRHLAGTLYAVEAAWELTEVERAIMTGRRGG